MEASTVMPAMEESEPSTRTRTVAERAELEVAGVVVGDADGCAGFAGAHGGVHGGFGLDVVGDLEDVGGGEGLDEAAALLGVDSSKRTVGDLADVGVDCVAEEEELQDGDEQREEEGAGVAEDVGELFARDGG